MYCIFAQLTNSNVLGKLPIRDANNEVNWELLLVGLAKTQYIRDGEGPELGTVHYLWEGKWMVEKLGRGVFIFIKGGGSSILSNKNLGDLKIFVALKTCE